MKTRKIFFNTFIFMYWLAVCLMISCKKTTEDPGPTTPITPLDTSSVGVGAPVESGGTWDHSVDLEVDGVHATVLPNGKVLYVPHRETLTGKTISAVLDPSNPGSVNYIEVPENFFCGGHSMLSDGRILFVGGEQNALKKSGIFDYRSETWTLSGDLNRSRWYPSAIQLGDGTIWAFGGQSEAAEVELADNTIEYYNPASGTWAMAGGQEIPGQHVEAYNRLHLLPDGKIFQSGHLPDSYIYDPNAGTWTFVARTQLGWPRGDAASVRLQDGRFMLVGGGDETTDQSTNTAEIIDLNDTNPQWKYTAPMNTIRVFNDAIVLPDGNVLVVGGDESSGSLQNTPEVYDPSSDTWTLVAPHEIHRSYHSTAILLPDARVIVGGGDGNSHHNPTGLFDESGTYEIWNPYYLQKSSRPEILEMESEAGYGADISIKYMSEVEIDRVVIYRGGVQTHSFSYNQISIPIKVQGGADSSTVFKIPDNPNLLPPSYYMVFLLNKENVPSVAKWIRIGS